ncbi:MAG: hypothetical protein QXS06_05165 [Desulfurococcaceae archaeon]
MRVREPFNALDEDSPLDTQDVGCPGVALKAPKGYANPRLMQGNRDEAMKPTNKPI